MSARLESELNHPSQRLGAIQPFVTVGFVLLFAVFPLLPKNVLVAVIGVIAALTIAGWVARWDVAVPLGLFCVTCMLLASFGLPSQLWFACGLGVCLSICKGVRCPLCQYS
jgi:hypothetical protein